MLNICVNILKQSNPNSITLQSQIKCLRKLMGLFTYKFDIKQDSILFYCFKLNDGLYQKTSLPTTTYLLYSYTMKYTQVCIYVAYSCTGISHTNDSCRCMLACFVPTLRWTNKYVEFQIVGLLRDI